MTGIQKTEWLEAECPICHQKYKYLVAYKPTTCGIFDCVREYLHRDALERIARIKNKGVG